MGGGRLREVVAHGGSTVSRHSDWLFNLVLKSIVTVGEPPSHLQICKTSVSLHLKL